MGRNGDARVGPHIALPRQWFLLKHIQGRSAELARIQCRENVTINLARTATHVDDTGPPGHMVKSFKVENSPGFLGQGKQADQDFAAVMQLLKSGHFSQFEKNLFEPLIRSINSAQDPWLTAADFRSFVDAQQGVADAFRDSERWTRMSILNTANSGKFSTDRTMLDYNRDIWRLTPTAPLP